MDSPSQLRVAASRRVGAFGLRGLEDFRRFFSREPMASAHYDWKTLPITVKTLRAIRDLATSHPSMAALGTQDVAVQYGITVGLTLAADLIDDPALVVPGLFGSAEPADGAPPVETFDEPQDIVS